MRRTIFLCFIAAVSLPTANTAARPDGLSVFWTDVEGGAATLVVTPAGESVLFDTGMPNERDRERIVKTVTETAGLEGIDHLVVTHFDLDHYGGAVGLAGRLPIGTVYDPGIPERMSDRLRAGVLEYLEMFGGRREVLEPGETLPLKRTGDSPAVEIRCLGANRKFASPGDGSATDTACAAHKPKKRDTSQNAYSIVALISHGPFRMLNAADLTWNLEHDLVCPLNRVGKVDVYQVDHHGLDQSNNPVLVGAIEPTVAVANNGPRKGPGPNTWKTLATAPSIRAIYQLHRNLKNEPGENTTEPRTANLNAECDGNHVELHTAADGSHYTLRIPATGLDERRETREK